MIEIYLQLFFDFFLNFKSGLKKGVADAVPITTYGLAIFLFAARSVSA
jgi:hypothetical protein